MSAFDCDELTISDGEKQHQSRNGKCHEQHLPHALSQQQSKHTEEGKRSASWRFDVSLLASNVPRPIAYALIVTKCITQYSMGSNMRGMDSIYSKLIPRQAGPAAGVRTA